MTEKRDSIYPSQPRENKPVPAYKAKSKLTRRQKLVRRMTVPLALVTAGAVTGEAVKPFETGANFVKQEVQNWLGTNEVKTYSFRGIKSLDSFKKEVESQFTVGNQVQVEDLTIAVPQDSPTLKIRYYARTLPDSAEGETGGIAVEIPPGKMLEIKNAAIVRGAPVEPNEPLSNTWFAVNLQQFGLEGYGYISNSSFTRSAVTPQGLEAVVVSGKAENGTLYFTKNNRQFPIGEVKMR